MSFGRLGMVILLLAGCDSPATDSDAGTSPRDAAVDAGRSVDAAGDTGPSRDAGARDAGDPDPDSGSDAAMDAARRPPALADWCMGSDTVIGALASAMEPRSWVEMPDDSGALDLDLHYSLLYWSDSAVWDSVERKVHWIGGPGTCCADPATYQRLTYDAVEDAWTMEATPFAGSGHAYDGNAFDSERGLHYFSKFHDEVVRVYDGRTWSDLPEIPFSATPTSGLAFFETDEGSRLVYVGRTGRVALWDGTRWTQREGAEDSPWGTYNNFAEPNPARGLVWMGAGNGGDRVHYAMSAAGEFRRFADAPISLNNSRALHAYEPVSGNFLVHDIDADVFYEFDPVADTWTRIDDMVDRPSFTRGTRFQVPIPDCGVVLFFEHYRDVRNVYLYRHG
ncbi:MAG: hypothetical protein AAGE52_34445 [Myxococcota bacterium]